MRHKSCFLFLLVCCSLGIQAQWTERDSLWLQEVLSGDVQIQLTPEAEKAIRSGTLLNLNPEMSPLLIAPGQLPFSKDLSEAALYDPTYREELIFSIPSQVFKRHIFHPDSGISIRKQLLIPARSLVVKDKIELGNGFYIRAGAQNLFLKEVLDGQSRGSIGGSAGATFSMEGILCALFSPTERNKKRNRRYARAWKDYNMEELPL